MTKTELIRGITTAWQLDAAHDIFTDPKMRPTGPPSRWSLPLLRALFNLSQKTTEHRDTVAEKLKESFDTRVAERANENKRDGKRVPSGMRVHVDDVAHAESYIGNLSDEESDTSSLHSGNSDHDSVASVAIIIPMTTAHQPPKLPPSFVPQKQGLLAHAERSVREAKQALVAERADLSAAIQGFGDIVADVADMDARLAEAYGGLGDDITTPEVREMEDRLRDILIEARDRMRLVGLAENRRNACRRDLKDHQEHLVVLRKEEAGEETTEV
jgi:hypothetical protein